jgi:hypothetical protein
MLLSFKRKKEEKRKKKKKCHGANSGPRGLGEESNYDYSKLKRKGKERESNASYFTINTSVCVR